MQRNIYEFSKEDLILRDLLATDRTFLANERTFLSYLRTALSIIVAGASFIKLFDIIIIRYIGYAFLPLGFILAIFSIVKYVKWGRMLRNIKNENDSYVIKHTFSKPKAKDFDILRNVGKKTS